MFNVRSIQNTCRSLARSNKRTKFWLQTSSTVPYWQKKCACHVTTNPKMPKKHHTVYRGRGSWGNVKTGTFIDMCSSNGRAAARSVSRHLPSGTKKKKKRKKVHEEQSKLCRITCPSYKRRPSNRRCNKATHSHSEQSHNFDSRSELTPDASGATKTNGTHYKKWCGLHWMRRDKKIPYSKLVSPFISDVVASRAGPRAVRTKRGRWREWTL